MSAEHPARWGVEVTLTVPDLTQLPGMVTDAERKVMTRYRNRILAFIKRSWTGWKYVGRPVNAPRNVSMQAWRGAVVVARGGVALEITNEARSWDTGESYVAYIARRKGAVPEYRKVAEALAAEFTDPLARDLMAEVQRSLLTGAPRRRIKGRPLGPDTAVIASALEL